MGKYCTIDMCINRRYASLLSCFVCLEWVLMVARGEGIGGETSNQGRGEG